MTSDIKLNEAEDTAVEVLLPNEETVAAIEEGQWGDLRRFASVRDLMANLREGD